MGSDLCPKCGEEYVKERVKTIKSVEGTEYVHERREGPLGMAQVESCWTKKSEDDA